MQHRREHRHEDGSKVARVPGPQMTSNDNQQSGLCRCGVLSRPVVRLRDVSRSTRLMVAEFSLVMCCGFIGSALMAVACAVWQALCNRYIALRITVAPWLQALVPVHALVLDLVLLPTV